jgi:tRNA1Val (adenine37-N6)-methyltransferase
MKVGTDAILLGCLAEIDYRESKVLDVGTGCGIIPLMLAQRYEDLEITGVEIDRHASEEAAYNFSRSPWPDRLHAIHQNFQDFSIDRMDAFDHIISNPPFFTGDKLSVYPSRTKSRHTVYLSHEEFIASAYNISHERARLSVILPTLVENNFVRIALQEGYHLTKKLSVRPKPKKRANRVVLSFSKRPSVLKTGSITIYDDNGSYSADYRNITQDYLL